MSIAAGVVIGLLIAGLVWLMLPLGDPETGAGSWEGHNSRPTHNRPLPPPPPPPVKCGRPIKIEVGMTKELREAVESFNKRLIDLERDGKG